jgi:hypothetical protein
MIPDQLFYRKIDRFLVQLLIFAKQYLIFLTNCYNASYK